MLVCIWVGRPGRRWLRWWTGRDRRGFKTSLGEGPELPWEQVEVGHTQVFSGYFKVTTVTANVHQPHLKVHKFINWEGIFSRFSHFNKLSLVF